MSVTTHPNDVAAGPAELQPKVAIELSLAEAEALHTWLLKAAADGVTSLDEPQVSAALATLSRAVDDAHVVIKVRRELANAGLSDAVLTDEQIRDLGRRVSHAVAPAVPE